MSGRLKDRLALITGASRGIGAATARAYAREGAHVILIARKTEGLEKIDDEIKEMGGQATLVPMDLKDYGAIDRMAAQIGQRWGRLDILVGNAGLIGDLTPVNMIDPEIWEQAQAVNVTANLRLIRAFDAHLRASEAGRAIFVTSGATRGLPPFWGHYTATKVALEALALTYAREIQNTKIRVNLVNPGPTRTQLRAAVFPGEDPLSLPEPAHVSETMIRLAEADFDGNGLWVAADTSEDQPDRETLH